MKKFILMGLLALTSIGFTQCGSDDDDDSKKSYKDITLYAGDGEAIDASDWVSGEPLIADYENDSIIAYRIGETTISGTLGSFKVTVKGKYNTYTEPIMDWGITMDEVKDRMSGNTIEKETSTILIYTVNSGAKYEMYLFDSDGNLKSSAVCVSTLYTSEVTKFLIERYVYFGNSDGTYAFKSIDEKMLIGISLEKVNGTYYNMVLYMPNDTDSSTTKKSFRALLQ